MHFCSTMHMQHNVVCSQSLCQLQAGVLVSGHYGWIEILLVVFGTVESVRPPRLILHCYKTILYSGISKISKYKGIRAHPSWALLETLSFARILFFFAASTVAGVTWHLSARLRLRQIDGDVQIVARACVRLYDVDLLDLMIVALI